MPKAAIKSELADWLDPLLLSGEAVAMLSLSGRRALHVEPKDVSTRFGHQVRYPLKHRRRHEPIDGISPHEYEIAAVFGCGDKGRAVAFRSCSSAPPRSKVWRPGDVIIAFRAVRTVTNRKDGFTESRADPADSKAMLSRATSGVPWLPDGKMRVTEGILQWYESCLCGGGEEGGLSSSADGVDGLLGWLDNQPWGAGQTLTFVGHSLGGSLAQLAALHVATVRPQLQPCTRVLAFGPISWADAATAAFFEATLGDRAAAVVTSGSLQPDALGLDLPWVLPPRISSAGECARLTVIDPLTAPFQSWQAPLHNTLELPLGEINFAESSDDEHEGGDGADGCGPDAAAATRGDADSESTSSHSAVLDEAPTPVRRTPVALLRKFFDTSDAKNSNEVDPMEQSYKKLHLGRAYQGALVDALFHAQAVHMRRTSEAVAAMQAELDSALKPGANLISHIRSLSIGNLAAAAGAATVDTPAPPLVQGAHSDPAGEDVRLGSLGLPPPLAPLGGMPQPGMRRNNSSKRSLAEMGESPERPSCRAGLKRCNSSKMSLASLADEDIMMM